MGFSAATLTVNTTVKVSGSIPAPGNAPSNTLTSPSTQPTTTATQTLTYGTSSGKLDVPCAGEYEIAAGGSLTLNLYDGGITTSDLVTLFGVAATLRNCKSLAISVKSGGDTSGVRIGAASSNEFVGWFAAAGDCLDIFPDGPAFSVGSPAGKAVTSSAKNVKITNQGAVAVVVQVVAGGTTVVPGTAMGVLGLTYA